MSDTRLKIAMVALDFNREGGSERRTAHLVDRLVAQGHEVHLVGARIRGEWDPRILRHRIPTLPRPHWLEVVQFCQGARAAVKRGDFDIAHNQIRPFVPGVLTVGGGCHRYYLEEVLPAERGRLLARRKRLAPLHFILLALERRGYDPAWCPLVLTNSRLAREGILKYYPYPAERIVVAHNGVDPERFRPTEDLPSRDAVRGRLGVGPGDLLLLFVGSGFARKGLGRLLQAVALAGGRGRQPRLVVVGGGSPEPWQRQAERLGVAGALRFLGAVPDPETYYRAADVFALPTHYDPFANATLEAMASGLPVITTRLNGVAEIIRPGVDGLLVDRPDEVEELAKALLLLTDQTTREVIGRAARATALRYPWDGPVGASLAAYRRVMAERSVGHGAPSAKS
jgi:UDP-glucose:(heptosyl)LPS alpha-1,3-glucosyltransferase